MCGKVSFSMIYCCANIVLFTYIVHEQCVRTCYLLSRSWIFCHQIPHLQEFTWRKRHGYYRWLLSCYSSLLFSLFFLFPSLYFALRLSSPLVFTMILTSLFEPLLGGPYCLSMDYIFWSYPCEVCSLKE